MKTWAPLLAILAVAEPHAAAQARRFVAGRLVSREVRLTSNCNPPGALAGPVLYGPGLTLPAPNFPPCEFALSPTLKTDAKLTYSRFTLEHPDYTPAGTLQVAGNSAHLRFDAPLRIGIHTNATWSLNPRGQPVGTHIGSYNAMIEAYSSEISGDCDGAERSGDAIGSLPLVKSCGLSATGAAWDNSTQTATFVVVNTVGFRFGNQNGNHVATVRTTYQASALDVDHIEILQSVQTPDHRVPLAAGKETLVRVFPLSATSDPGMRIRVRLAMLRDERVVRTWDSGVVTPSTGTSADRGNLERSANFRIPPELTTVGPVRFEAEILAPGPSGVKKSQTAAFQAAQGWPSPFRILATRVCEDPLAPCASSPSSVGVWREWAPTPETVFVDFGTQLRDAALGKVALLRFLWESLLPASSWADQYTVLHPNAPVAADPANRKISSVNSPLAFGCVFGRNLGLMRGDATTSDPGYHFAENRLVPADTPEALNCAEGASWISAANAVRLFDAYRDRGPQAASGTQSRLTVISGTIDGASVSFNPLVSIVAGAGAPSAGPYCLAFTNASGAATRDPYCFDAADPGAFAVRAALPDSTARIALSRAGQELGAVTRSANAPAVRFGAAENTALGRYVRVSWSANDPDGDALWHQLWGSIDDGQTWLPIAIDLENSELLLDTAAFPTASSIRLMARASDGFWESVAYSGQIASSGTPVMERPAALTIPDAKLNEALTVRLPIRNTGTSVLRIEAVESQLTSLRVRTPLPLLVTPDDTGMLELAFAASETGRISGALAIRSNDPAAPSVVLPVTGTVFEQTGPAVTLSVKALDFGAVHTGASSEQRAVVRNAGNAALTLNNIVVTGLQALRVAGMNTASIEPGSSAEIVVRCTPTAAGAITGTLTAATNDPTMPRLALPLACTGRIPSLEAPASMVDFGTVASGQTRTQPLTIRNLTAQPIEIATASVTNAQFHLANPRLPVTIPANSFVNLEVAFAPTVAGIATGALTLNSSNEEVGSITVNLRGTGTSSAQADGRLSVTPQALAFGEVIINQSRTLVLSLRNSGTGLLTVTRVESNNPAFTVAGIVLPLSIPSGAVVDVPVRFSPTTTVSFNSVLMIASDSVTASDLLISMTGTGMPIPATTVSNLATTLRQDWNGRATIVSFGPDDAILRLVRFDSAGTQGLDTGITIPPGLQQRAEIDSGAGWVQARVGKGTVQGYVQYVSQQNQAFDVLPLNPQAATRFILTGLERGSDILLNNLVSDNNAVGLDLRANSGASVGTANIVLNPRSSLAQRVEQLFAGAPQTFQGYLLVSAAQPVQVTRTNNGVNSMEAILAQPTPAAAARSVTLYAPRLQSGNGWLARLQVVNPTEREARLTIRSASSAGIQMSPVTVTLAPGAAYWREYTQIFDLNPSITWNVSMTVESTVAGLVAEMSYGNSFARSAYALLETGARRSVAPVNNANTALYIMNPGPLPVSVSIRALEEGGTYSAGRRETIPAGGFYGGPTGLPEAPAVRLESDQPVFAYAQIAAEQGNDFGILQVFALDTSVTGPPAGASPRLQVDPGSLHFDQVAIGQSRVLTLNVRNGGTATMTVQSIASSSSRFTVEGVTLPFRVPVGVTQPVQIRYTAAAPAGPASGSLTVISDDALTGPVVVSLTGTGTATETPRVQIVATPTLIDFGDVNSGQTGDRILSIRNGGSENLVVSGIAIGNSRFQLIGAAFPLTVIPAGLAEIRVRFAPAAAGVQTGTLVISSNDASNPAVSIALRGNGVGVASSPRIVVTAASLEFGTVRVGQTGELSFEIRNPGTAPLIVQSLTVDHVAYSAGPVTPFTVFPGGGNVVDVAVVFRPREAGSQPGTLRIVSNDPANPVIIIPMTGAGQLN